MMRLDPESIRAVAEEVARLLMENATTVGAKQNLVDAHAIAHQLGRSPAWVRSHADELGAVRLGAGERPRLAFDPCEVAARVNALSTASPPPRRRQRRPSASPPTSGAERTLLPIRGVPA